MLCTSVTGTFTVVKPFFRGDAAHTLRVLQSWDDNCPCSLDNATLQPSSSLLPAELVLYFAGDVKNNTRDMFDGVMTSTADWHNCFTSIRLLGAGLTAVEDQYHSRTHEIDWNLGPNLQFYRMLNNADVGTVFYYMEGDIIPVVHPWLDVIANNIMTLTPFSVIGGLYAGHNWDTFDDNTIKPALRNHLNGNAIYNKSHRLIQKSMRAFTDTFASEPHSSFDVALSELLIEEENVALDALPLEGNGYKATPTFANFANTLVLPQDISPDAVVLHGGIYYRNWPANNCTRFEHLGKWYPGAEIYNVHSTLTSLSLVVTDFNDGAFDDFYASLRAAQATTFSTLPKVEQETCYGPTNKSSLAGLPFDDVIVMTDRDSANFNAFAERYAETTVVNRSLETQRHWFQLDDPNFFWPLDASDPRRINMWWDLCRAPVTTEWFMFVTTELTFDNMYKLPIDLTTHSVAPIIPFLDYDSAHCSRLCRNAIMAARAINPTWNKYVHQRHAVLHTATRNAYCKILDVRTAEPSITGYYAYADMQEAAAEDECDRTGDESICVADAMLAGCRQRGLIGDSIRKRCPATCGVCALRTNNARQHEFHVMPSIFHRIAEPVRCEDDRALIDMGKCPCVFPFFYNGKEYTDCAPMDPFYMGQRFCPTSVNNLREFVPMSEDWRICNLTSNHASVMRHTRHTTNITLHALHHKKHHRHRNTRIGLGLGIGFLTVFILLVVGTNISRSTSNFEPLNSKSQNLVSNDYTL